MASRRCGLGIARAAVLTPDLGLFDQPIAGLDPVTASRILALIVNLTEQLGMATVPTISLSVH